MSDTSISREQRLDPSQIAEAITRLTYMSTWPNALAALLVAKDARETRVRRDAGGWKDDTMDIRRSSFHVTAVAAIALMIESFYSPTFASGEVACAQQESVASSSLGDAPSPLQRIRIACPLLGRIVEHFAAQDLGEAFASEEPESSARASAMVTAFAALNDADAMKRYARDALDAGATRLELKELIYLTAVSAGVPKAIVATQAVSELLVGQADRCADQSWQAELRHF